MLPRITMMLCACAALLAAPGLARDNRSKATVSARDIDGRARALVRQMTLDEKIAMLHGSMPIALPGRPNNNPADALPSAGYIPGIARLGIPPLRETDASLGVTNPLGLRKGDTATALPSGLSLASSFDPDLAYRAGAMVGAEARAKGFNVLLGGGVNLARDPRNGRNFEYLGEDPLLAGVLAGETVRGAQAQGIIATVKHFALNDNETNRHTLDARIDRAALRESDLLAFQIAIERGRPGSVMCAYNKVNGSYSCSDRWLLNDVLKDDWGFPGWVMSDWGAVHSVDDALAGLDQQSGEQFDPAIFFGAQLKAAVESGRVPVARIDDMVARILRSMIAAGLLDTSIAAPPIDAKASAAVALQVARQGIVLLKNDGDILPLAATAKRIAVIGGNAQIGVLSGGGSSQVTPSNGPSIIVPIGGDGPMAFMRRAVWFPSSPYAEISKRAGQARVTYDAGQFPADAAAAAAKADVAIVFVTRHEMEGADAPDMSLGQGQDALVDAVAAANPNTIVVLETGNPVAMPWADKVKALLAAWYPGQEGGQAIAEVLFGEVNPSGRLPISWPVNEAQTVRPALPNFGTDEGVPVTIDHDEGADIGYRWYARHSVRPLYPFGHGLSFSRFSTQELNIAGGIHPVATVTVRNEGRRAGADVVQLYLQARPQGPAVRLLGFARVDLKPGELRRVRISIDPRLFADFDEARRKWRTAPGAYRVAVGADALHLTESVTLTQRGIIADDR
jgi:beta-glucosidase